MLQTRMFSLSLQQSASWSHSRTLALLRVPRLSWKPRSPLRMSAQSNGTTMTNSWHPATESRWWQREPSSVWSSTGPTPPMKDTTNWWWAEPTPAANSLFRVSKSRKDWARFNHVLTLKIISSQQDCYLVVYNLYTQMILLDLDLDKSCIPCFNYFWHSLWFCLDAKYKRKCNWQGFWNLKFSANSFPVSV